MTPELIVVSMVRAVVEIAGWFMLGQGLLYVLAGRRRSDNVVYQLFTLLTRPVMRITRAITPRVVRDEHIPLAAFILVLWLWISLGIAKRYICVSQNLVCT